MKSILSERNLVVILFVMVLVTFSFAQEDSKKITRMYSGVDNTTSAHYLGQLTAGSQAKNAAFPNYTR
jgi:hypothetical protein